MGGFFSTVAANAQQAARDRLKSKADELKADRTPKKAKTDRHAESLIREAAAIEAQIRNLYALADAYGVSGAAALIAEARVKAESHAIKQRADIEASVDRQVRLSIAERVSDAAKAGAATREQAIAQEQVNAMVMAGLIPAERAAELVRDRIADLPLLAALEAAQQRGLAAEVIIANKALEDQRKARERMAAAEATSRYNSAIATGVDRLAELQEEMRLIGSTDVVRARALATIRATQEAERLTNDPAERAAYIAQQVQIADLEVQRQLRADAFNDSLHYQADLLDAVATNVGNAAQGN